MSNIIANPWAPTYIELPLGFEEQLSSGYPFKVCPADAHGGRSSRHVVCPSIVTCRVLGALHENTFFARVFGFFLGFLDFAPFFLGFVFFFLPFSSRETRRVKKS